jgi:hypothetical protein
MALAYGRRDGHDLPVHDRERSRIGGARNPAPTRRSSVPGHPLLALQRAAGNAAVAHLVADLNVQRLWPFDDDEEEVEKNPEEFPNGPEEEPDEGPGGPEEARLPDPMAPVQWVGVVHQGGFEVTPIPFGPGAVPGLSVGPVVSYVASLPYEPIPPATTGGIGILVADATRILASQLDVVGRQVFRAWVGNVSPDIERIVNGPGGGPGPTGPGGGPAPGGGPVPGGGPGPGGIPGMEPVPPGPGPGGIPGMEPVPPGPGPGGGPGMEPVPPGGGAGPTPGHPTVRIGSAGDAVRQAQELLVRHGASLDPDGQFGQLTRSAVIEFQRASGLAPDGIVGPQTWRALESP